tara:strand:+ start:16307 stop:17740 length:1434 start_codon:yes stop_codon:yes gene_type:complete
MFTVALLSGCPSSTKNTKEGGLTAKDKDILQKGRLDIQGLVSKGKQYAAIKQYQTLFQKNTDNPVYYYLYGYALKNKKKKWRLFDLCLRRNPEFFWCLVGRGRIYTAWRVWDRAKGDFELAEKSLPGRVEPLLGKAEIAFARKRNEKAVELYKSALAKEANNADANYGLAVLYERLGQRKNSISWYQKFLKQQPEHFEALRAVGKLYKAEKQNSEAASHWERALKLRPKLFRLHIRLAQTYEEMGSAAKALALYERASRLPQVHFKTFFRLGVLRAGVGNIDGAIKALSEALKLEREHDETLFRLGTLYLQKGEPKQAILYLRRAVRVNGKRVESRKNLAKAHIQRKEYADALRQYQEILKRAPKDASVRTDMKKLLDRLGLSDQPVRGPSVRGVLKKCQGIIYKCYKTRLKEQPKLKGKLVVKLAIPKSQPVRVSWDLEKSTLKDPLVQACVKWTLRRAVFPRRGIRITYDFSFRP